jgi:hypothetical protein
MAWMPRVTPKVEQLVARAPERTIFTRFIPPEKPENAPGRWARLLRKVVSCNRRQIDNRLIDLLPALARYAPPAGIFDKTVCTPLSATRNSISIFDNARSTRSSFPGWRLMCACCPPFLPRSIMATGSSLQRTRSAVPQMKVTMR